MLDLNMATNEQLITEILTLRSQVAYLQTDQAFGGILNRNAATLQFPCIPSGKTLVLIDLANMHGLNHKHTMCGADCLIRKMIDSVRHTDTVIRWGGDEIVIMADSTDDITAYLNRLDGIMAECDLYAVYGVVTTSNDITESVNRADALVMAVKTCLELNGLKASRDEQYVRMDSHIVYE